MERPFTYQSEFVNSEHTKGLVRGFKDFSGFNNVRRFAVLADGRIFATAWTDDRNNWDAPGRVWFPIGRDHIDYSKEFEFTGWYDIPKYIEEYY